VTAQPAAYVGHIETFTWALDHDCPWDRRTRTYATGEGHTELLRLVEDNRCPPLAADEPLEEDAEEDDRG